jgi:hypothetical protein
MTVKIVNFAVLNGVEMEDVAGNGRIGGFEN